MNSIMHKPADISTDAKSCSDEAWVANPPGAFNTAHTHTYTIIYYQQQQSITLHVTVKSLVEYILDNPAEPASETMSLLGLRPRIKRFMQPELHWPTAKKTNRIPHIE